MGRLGSVGGASWLFFLVLVQASCGSERSASPARSEEPSARAPVEEGKGRPPRRPAVPSFRSDILPVLATSCAGAHGCHGEQPTDRVDLDLRPERAYEDLVGRPAKARPGALRVAPGDPQASFLVGKLVGPLAGSEGKSMPTDPQSGAAAPMTPPAREFVDRVLGPWIQAGAPDN